MGLVNRETRFGDSGGSAWVVSGRTTAPGTALGTGDSPRQVAGALASALGDVLLLLRLMGRGLE